MFQAAARVTWFCAVLRRSRSSLLFDDRKRRAQTGIQIAIMGLGVPVNVKRVARLMH